MIDLSPYKLVIFDKDGTLIDFDVMWSGWVESLTVRLEAATGRRLAGPLYQAMEFDPATHHAIAGGPLAVMPMAQLRKLASAVLRAQGLAADQVDAALAREWRIPDPATTARPLADLTRLFVALRDRGLKIAVATNDDHVPTVATLASLGLAHLVDVVIAADDDVLLKPKPDMLWAACRATGVEPGQAIVVGDGVPELQMARAAGAGLVVGVTSGVSGADLLAPHADIVLHDVSDLVR